MSREDVAKLYSDSWLQNEIEKAAARLALPKIRLPSVHTIGIIAIEGLDRSFIEADRTFDGLFGPPTFILLFTSNN